MPVDIVIAGSGLEKEFLDRAAIVDVEGVRLPIITPEDLVISKVLAGRPRDLADATTVLKAQPDLSLDRVRSVLALLEQALDQSDLLPTLERIVRDSVSQQ